MSDVFAPFTLPLRREGDAAIVDAAGETVLVIDPDRRLEDDQATAIADHVFARSAAALAPAVGATLRHHDGRTGTFVCIEGDGRYRVQSLKGKGFWVFRPGDCEQLRSGAAPAALVSVPVSEYQRLIDVAENLIGELSDPGTEALAAVYCARRIIESAPAAPQAAGVGEVAHWMRDLLGDDQNGGFIRNLCYTVWQAGRSGYNGAPGDWANDTLPTVQEGVKLVRAKVEGLLSLRAPSREPEGGA